MSDPSLWAVGDQLLGTRAEQQDHFGMGTARLSDGRCAPIVVLADGMGGHRGGKIAAGLAVENFLDQAESAEFSSFPELLHKSLLVANRAIGEHARGNPALGGMGCTLIATILIEDLLHYISVGDSPLLRLNSTGLVRVNADHSMAPLIDQRLASGEIEADDEVLTQRFALRSALTGATISLVDSRTIDVQPNEWFLLASDGLLTLDPPTIAQTIIDHSPRGAEQVVERLLALVAAAGLADQDNCSVVAFKTPNRPAASSKGPSRWGGWLMIALGLSIVLMVWWILFGPGDRDRGGPIAEHEIPVPEPAPTTVRYPGIAYDSLPPEARPTSARAQPKTAARREAADHPATRQTGTSAEAPAAAAPLSEQPAATVPPDAGEPAPAAGTEVPPGPASQLATPTETSVVVP